MCVCVCAYVRVCGEVEAPAGASNAKPEWRPWPAVPWLRAVIPDGKGRGRKKKNTTPLLCWVVVAAALSFCLVFALEAPKRPPNGLAGPEGPKIHL